MTGQPLNNGQLSEDRKNERTALQSEDSREVLQLEILRNISVSVSPFILPDSCEAFPISRQNEKSFDSILIRKNWT